MEESSEWINNKFIPIKVLKKEYSGLPGRKNKTKKKNVQPIGFSSIAGDV